MQKIIFLDIDGVLNTLHPGRLVSGREYGYARFILPGLVERFNQIVDTTDAKIVISSSWRNLIHSGHMDLYGFAAMMRSHNIRGEIIGITRENPDGEPRFRQILAWLAAHRGMAERFCVIDDDPQAFGELDSEGCKLKLRLPGILTEPHLGLEPVDVAEAIKLLLGATAPTVVSEEQPLSA